MPSRTKGLSLIELIVVFALMALLAGLTIPFFTQNFLLAHEGNALRNRLVQALELARSESLRTHKKTTVCGSKSLASCDGHWNHGFIVLASGKLLLQQKGPRQGVWHATTTAIEFHPKYQTATPARLTYIPVDNSKAPMLSLVLNTFGRIRLD